MTGARHGFRLRRPRPTVRWRLTLLYGSLFLASGAALLAITYTLVSNATLTTQGPGPFTVSSPAPGGGVPASRGGGPLASSTRPRQPVQQNFAQIPVPEKLRRLLATRNGRIAVHFLGAKQRVSDLHHLIVESAIALTIMAILSTILGWLMAGRVLRPLREITATAHDISEANLHQRLAMSGPNDELRELADTIDALLARLQDAFGAQRRFVANASHELRTPLTTVRALLEMVITDPRATVATFRATCRQVLEESEHQERLIDALLVLAQGQRGLVRHDEIDLSRLVADAWAVRSAEAAATGIESHLVLEPAVIAGDPGLVERLVSNLLENAIRHNRDGGEIEVAVAVRSGRAVLSVSNSGQPVAPDEIPRLLTPFQRLGPERAGHGAGLGLGLSIVKAVADAHDADLELQPRPGGGIQAEVRFPAAWPSEAEPLTASASASQLV